MSVALDRHRARPIAHAAVTPAIPEDESDISALILATEPAWALLAAVVLAGQHFGLFQAIGAALLMLAIIGHEVLAARPSPTDGREVAAR